MRPTWIDSGPARDVDNAPRRDACPSGIPAGAPPGVHFLTKPSGSTCNIDCTYWFFLSKEALYANDKPFGLTLVKVSSETVKKHARNLYQKLEVNGRREAVARAMVERLVSVHT